MAQILYLISLPNASLHNVIGPLQQRFKKHRLGKIHAFETPMFTVGVTLNGLMELSEDLVALNTSTEVLNYTILLYYSILYYTTIPYYCTILY